MLQGLCFAEIDYVSSALPPSSVVFQLRYGVNFQRLNPPVDVGFLEPGVFPRLEVWYGPVGDLLVNP